MKTNTYCSICGALLLLATLLQACNTASEGIEETVVNEAKEAPSGHLFIIGGGKRPAHVLAAMMDRVQGEVPFGLVFPHASAEPDSAYHYFVLGLDGITDMPLVKVGQGTLRTSLIDSVKAASFIFITGGDQNRFLDRVHPAVQRAIKDAYYMGAVIGGTSAGAALMSHTMITGDQRDWPLYESTYARLHHNNGIYDQGLGLIDSVVVDQHFVARSRYNRLISALADTGYPYAVGVDEETAFVVGPGYYTVVGNNQVVVIKHPVVFSEKNARIGARNLITNIYLEGDTFQLKKIK